MASPSNYTRVTFIINNGTYGHAETHVINKSLRDPALRDNIETMMGLRKTLLGNGQAGGPPYIKASDTPQIQFVRLTDALQPRLGQVWDYTKQNYFGKAGVALGDNSADFFATAMTVRMISQRPDESELNTTLQIIGQPDGVYANGFYVPGYALPGGVAWQDVLQLYLGALTGATGIPWGIMGTDQAQPVVQCTEVANVGGQWQFTFPTATWNTGDRVRFSRFNPVFNGTWTLIKTNPVGPIYALRNQPVSGHTVPPLGRAVLVQQQSGVNAKIFIPYEGYQITFGNIPQVKPAKHNPGRQWLNVSFHHRVRRER